MFREKLEKAIEDIQSKNKEIKLFPNLIDVCEPGESGFIPRSVGSTGYLLVCPIDIKSRKSIIEKTRPTLIDYMGVSPFLMVVMESGSSFYEPYDIVQIDRESLPMNPDGTPRFNQIIVKSALAIFIPESSLVGKDKYLTDLAKVTLLKQTIIANV